MKVDIDLSGVTVSEGTDSLILNDLDREGKILAGAIYSTPIADGSARYIKSATAKVIYSLDDAELPPERFDGVSAVLTLPGFALAKQAEALGIEVVPITLRLQDINENRLASLSDEQLEDLHKQAHDYWSEGK